MNLIIKNIGEIFRYGLVGMILNATMYFVYLIFTAFYFSPLGAVFLLYPLGVLVGFFAHRRISFKLNSQTWRFSELSKYVFVYVVGFFLNLLILFVFFKRLGYPHQLVQLSAIFIVASFVFICLRIFVFLDVQDKDS